MSTRSISEARRVDHRRSRGGQEASHRGMAGGAARSDAQRRIHRKRRRRAWKVREGSGEGSGEGGHGRSGKAAAKEGMEGQGRQRRRRAWKVREGMMPPEVERGGHTNHDSIAKLIDLEPVRIAQGGPGKAR